MAEIIGSNEKDKIIELGGRKFRAIENSTIEHDLTVMQLLGEVGLDSATQQEGESYDDFAVRVLSLVIASGKAFELIGTFLIKAEEADEDWTPESGRNIGRFVSKLCAQEDKLQIRQLVVTLLVGFSQAGLLSYAVSPASSTEDTVAARPIARTGSRPGASSSARSEASIQPGMWRSAAALWRKVFPRTGSSSGDKHAPTTS
jgi:hypothetical protein